jgi:hypothetical protein
MDLGLGNLATVKNFVLPAAIVGDTSYDGVLAAIASGIAGRFQSYCNRRFARVVNDISRFPANRSHYYLPRYPFETVASLTLRATAQDPWSDVTSAIIQKDELIGLIDFYVILADEMSLLQCTYTGGFWYETKEPTDAGYPTAQPGGQYNPSSNPTGSFGLTDPIYGAPSLQEAWLIQCLHEFQSKDRLLPEGLADRTKSRSDLRFEQMQLLPEVQNAIGQYRRYQIV